MSIDADNILVALPFKPNTRLFESLKGKVPEIYAVGDAVGVAFDNRCRS